MNHLRQFKKASKTILVMQDMAITSNIPIYTRNPRIKVIPMVLRSLGNMKLTDRPMSMGTNRSHNTSLGIPNKIVI
jgi:hypothetical protein